VVFVAYVSLIEAVVRVAIMVFMPRIVIRSFGVILLIPMVLAIVIGCFFPLVIKITGVGSFILVYILAYLVRKFVIDYVFEKKIIKKMQKKDGKNGK
ncbi:MAG: hypothetical protein WCS56_04875, partial [Bacilli bacterium]